MAFYVWQMIQLHFLWWPKILFLSICS
jgi:hypothetical protein